MFRSGQITFQLINRLSRMSVHPQRTAPAVATAGGFRIVPHQIEFWQGGEDRLHDRFEYNRDENGNWNTQRMMP